MTLTIVDTAGGWSDACRGAMAAADFCLIPARPSPADIEAAAPTLAAVRGAQSGPGPQRPPKRGGRLARRTRGRAEDGRCAGAARNRTAQ
jgi:chromosome partitioning protein